MKDKMKEKVRICISYIHYLLVYPGEEVAGLISFLFQCRLLAFYFS